VAEAGFAADDAWAWADDQRSVALEAGLDGSFDADRLVLASMCLAGRDVPLEQTLASERLNDSAEAANKGASPGLDVADPCVRDALLCLPCDRGQLSVQRDDRDRPGTLST
jgi:hypothetical protein